MPESADLGAAISAAVRAVDRALANEMRTQEGASAAPRSEQLRQELLAMRARGVVDAAELRTMIRDVAAWTPEEEVTLLAALGGIARARS
jgi:hypothetical protein